MALPRQQPFRADDAQDAPQATEAPEAPAVDTISLDDALATADEAPQEPLVETTLHAAQVGGVLSYQPAVVGPDDDADPDYFQVGEWAGIPNYGNRFDTFTSTDETRMVEYVAGLKRRAVPTPGALTDAVRAQEEAANPPVDQAEA